MNFIDDGIDFNPRNKDAPDLTLSIDKKEIGWRLTIVRKNAGKIDYRHEDNQNIITIEKIV